MNLQLSLKLQWFEMTDEGIKPEDYRLPTPYWCNRFLLYKGENISKERWRVLLVTSGIYYMTLCIGEEITFKSFASNIMTLGYPSKTDESRILRYEHAGIEIRTGVELWGAEPNKLYFVIKHGKRIN